jgi:sigma-B regulation protein RsbU (phosphoserine phosphatase)
VGLIAKASFEEARVDLAPGDLLMLYSDGVTDAINSVEEEFGADRAIAVLQRYRDCPAAEVCDRMFATIDAFAGGAPQYDDITMMVMKRL